MDPIWKFAFTIKKVVERKEVVVRGRDSIRFGKETFCTSFPFRKLEYNWRWIQFGNLRLQERIDRFIEKYGGNA